MQIKIQYDVESRTKPGGGNVAGKVRKGIEFEIVSSMNGWNQIFHLGRNIWVPVNACLVLDVIPDEPLPVKEIVQIRYGYIDKNNNVTWQQTPPPKTYGEL